MVFSTTNLFKGIQCPEGKRCKLTNCIYGHDLRPQATNTPKPKTAAAALESAKRASEGGEPDPKRRKVKYTSLADAPQVQPERAYLQDGEYVRWNVKSLAKPAQRKSTSPLDFESEAAPTKPKSPRRPSFTTLERPVSPPSRKAPKSPGAVQPKFRKAAPKETLNPRQIPNSPEAHAKRTVLLRMMHGEMVKLNQFVEKMASESGKSPNKWTRLKLGEQELIKGALDEEEQVARQSPKVYGNVIKNRIQKYKKMGVEDWANVVKASFGKAEPESPDPPPPPAASALATGLSPAEELQVLHQLVIPDQHVLARFDYVAALPTAAEAEEAAKAVETSHNFEKCDRCDARFQVFPDRNGEGLLTSRGPCTFHANRPIMPIREKTDAYTGAKRKFHPCCMGEVGSPGCTERADHVFKSSSPARMAAVLPFITTPKNDNPAKDRQGEPVHAVAFDCEMGYTTLGFELVRLTAVSWPQGHELLDILVRPLGTVLDLNSRFSGVWPKMYGSAIPYDTWLNSPPPKLPKTAEPGDSLPLPVVDSPQKARELLCSFLTPNTPLIGHAIENDLNVTRLCHPTIVDTVILFPNKAGLPCRSGLRALTKEHLKRNIQTGGERGHDSLEDSIATGDLVRVKVKETLDLMWEQGWYTRGDQLVEPIGWERKYSVGAVMLSRVLKQQPWQWRNESGPVYYDSLQNRRQMMGLDGTQGHGGEGADEGKVGNGIGAKSLTVEFLEDGTALGKT